MSYVSLDFRRFILLSSQIPGQLWHRQAGDWTSRLDPVLKHRPMGSTKRKGLVFTGMSTTLPAVYKNCGLPRLGCFHPPRAQLQGQRKPGLAHPYEMVAVCTLHQPPPTQVPAGHPTWAQRKEVGTYQRWLTSDEYHQFSVIHFELTLEFQHQRRTSEVIFYTVILNLLCHGRQSKSF